MHISYTIKDIQTITDNYTNANEQKRSIVVKLVQDYFKTLKMEI